MFYHFPNVDHHLTTAVQLSCKMSEKLVVMTNNRLFLVLGVAVQNQQILRFNVCLYCHVVVLRQLRQGRFLALFCAMHRDLRSQKRGGQR